MHYQAVPFERGGRGMSYDELLAELARQHAAEIDADKLELRLWALSRAAQRAECRTRRHPKGIELVVLVDGELSSSSAFRPQDLGTLEASAEAIRRAFEDDGWTPAGPH
jgi:hypothetical protein